MNTSGTAHAHTTEADAASARVSPLRRRVITAATIAGVAALAVGGAAAADESKPGDALYEIDRALEDLGINDGGSEERLDEAEELVEEGDVEVALEAVDEAVEDMDDLDEEDAEELTGLLHAAESVLSNGSEQSLERRTQVAEMLTFMATTDLKGKEFGQAVSAHARGTWVDPEDVEEATDEEMTDETVTDEDAAEEEELVLADDEAESSDKADTKAEAKELKDAAKQAAKDAKAEAKAFKKAAKDAAKEAKANAKANR